MGGKGRHRKILKHVFFGKDIIAFNIEVKQHYGIIK